MYLDEQAAGEVDRLVAEHGYTRQFPAVCPRDVANKRNSLMFSPLRPSNAGLTDGYRDARLSYGEVDIDGARRELASLHPLLGVETVEAAALVLTAGERDPESQGEAVVYLAMLPEETRPREIQRLALAADLTREERRAAARKGHALKDGSYPITHGGRGPGSLHSAAVLAASGHGDVAAARKLIMQRAHELGVDIDTLPGFSRDNEDLKEQAERERRRRGGGHHHHGSGSKAANDDDYDGGSSGPSGGAEGGGSGGSMAATRVLMQKADGTYGTIALTGAQEDELGLAAGYGPGPVEDYLTLAAAQFAPDGGVTGTPGYRLPFKVHDVTEDGDPTDKQFAEIDRLIRENPAQFGASAREDPHGASYSTPPRSLAARNRQERRQNSRPENRISA